MHIKKPEEAPVDPLASLRAPISALRFSTTRYPGFGLTQVQDYRKPIPKPPANNGPLNTSLQNFTANDPGGPGGTANTDRKGNVAGTSLGDFSLGINDALAVNSMLNSALGTAVRAAVPGMGVVGALAGLDSNNTAANALGVDTSLADGARAAFGRGPSIEAIDSVGLKDGDFNNSFGVPTPNTNSVQTRGHDRMGPPGNESGGGGDLDPAGNSFGGGLDTGNSGAAEAAAAADAAAGEGNGSGGGMGSAGMGDGTSEPGGRGGFAQGGPVTGDRLAGPNPPGPDDGQASLDIGETVITAAITQQLGPDAMAVINSGQFDAAAVRQALGLGAS